MVGEEIIPGEEKIQAMDKTKEVVMAEVKEAGVEILVEVKDKVVGMTAMDKTKEAEAVMGAAIIIMAHHLVEEAAEEVPCVEVLDMEAKEEAVTETIVLLLIL